MEQKHAHEVLHMMVGNSYSEESLAKAIKDKFGTDQTFYACSAENMNIQELIQFLKMKGKFMPAVQEDGFTVDVSKVCNH
jgi:probable metal-binding protein